MTHYQHDQVDNKDFWTSQNLKIPLILTMMEKMLRLETIHLQNLQLMMVPQQRDLLKEKKRRWHGHTKMNAHLVVMNPVKSVR